MLISSDNMTFTGDIEQIAVRHKSGESQIFLHCYNGNHESGFVMLRPSEVKLLFSALDVAEDMHAAEKENK